MLIDWLIDYLFVVSSEIFHTTRLSTLHLRPLPGSVNFIECKFHSHFVIILCCLNYVVMTIPPSPYSRLNFNQLPHVVGVFEPTKKLVVV